MEILGNFLFFFLMYLLIALGVSVLGVGKGGV